MLKSRDNPGRFLAVPLVFMMIIFPLQAMVQQDDDVPPSLDELLGIEEDEENVTAAEIAERQAEEELQRRLNAQEITDAFEFAIHKMTLSAELLDERFDTGLGTQRVQEEVLAKLDQLIDEAKKQCKGSGSGSGSSQGQRSKEQKPGKQGGDPSQEKQRQDQPAGESKPGDPPSPQQGDLNTVLQESRAEWGSLPQRVRDMLLQGREEKFSSLYEQLTREYYRRLAEEGSSQ